MSVPIISIKGLGKRYVRKEQGAAGYLTFRETIVNFFHPSPTKTNVDYFWALKNINLDIYPGEIVGIIGRNGAGKSTLLKILSRITEPTKGEFMLTGRVASLLEVGTGFHPELSGRENIYLSGAILGMKKGEINTRFDEIVAFAGVEDFLDLPIKRYSSGMQVRLGFAVAAHLEADVLLLDEVLAVGDAEFQKKSLSKVKSMVGNGQTVVMVSHQMESITTFCSKAILFDNGEVINIGASDAVVSTYLSSQNTMRMTDKTGSIRSFSFEMDGALFATGTYKSRMKINVEFVCDGVPIYNPVLGITIKNQRLNPVSGVNNRNYNVNFPTAKWWRGHFSVEFDCTPLLPGVYSVDLHIGDKTGDRERLYDAFLFHILSVEDELPLITSLPQSLNMLRLPNVSWNLAP